MLALRGYRWCLFASTLTAIPIHPGALLGIPFGIWALITISRPQIAQEFR
jgi:hypothetical protein